MQSYLIIDIENDSSVESKKKGRKAGTPLLGDQIVAIALKNAVELTAEYLYPNSVKELHIDEDVLVGHNLSHDLQWFWHLDSLQDFFKRGGKVWDTQLAHYILTGQSEKYPSLREIAVKDYGQPERPKFMEEYWEAGKMTHEIPKDLVLKDVKQDVLDTEQIYLQQRVLAVKQNQEKLIELQNDALLATFECSYNGMKINQDHLIKNKQELEAKISGLHNLLQEAVKESWK